jgi:hypothetical protein
MNLKNHLFDKFSSAAVLALAALALTHSAVQAGPVWNVNFHNQITTTENFLGAAVENTTNSTWNKIGGAANSLPVTGMVLADFTGLTTAGVTITLSAINTTPVTALSNTNNQTLLTGPKIFNGWIGAQYKQTTFTLSGLVPSSTYDLLVYSDWWWKNGDPLAISQTMGTGMTGITYIDRPVTGLTNGNVTGLSQDTNSANVPATQGNWYRLSGLTPNSSGQLGFLMGDQPNDGNLGNSAFNGFQLIQMGGGLPDTTPPTPTPMTWLSPPAAAGSASITMTATTASDASGVEYSFTETSGNPGATNSGWQNSSVYTDTGLTANITYTYTVTARDKSSAQNATTASAPASATTTNVIPQNTTVWNVNMGGQITTADNYVGAASENTPNSTWNRVASVPQTNMALKDSTGATTAGVTLNLTGSNVAMQNLLSGDKIFNGYIGGAGATANLTIGGLSATNSYDVIIYSDWWWKNGDSYPVRQTIGTGLASTIYVNRLLSGTNGNVVALTEDTDPGNSGVGNWYRIRGLSPDANGQIGFLLGDGANSPFNGFQLLATPIPPRADMMTFGLPGNPAIINGLNVTLTMPYGSNVTNLAPAFTLWPGASCTPVTGTARNFSSAQTYTVTSSDSLVTKIYTVTAVIAPPLPEFTLTAPATWDGRQTITIQPNITNLALLQATGGTNFNYQWSVSGLAVTQQVTPGVLTLTRSQGSGPLLVALTMSNGTSGVTVSTTINVQEPATDPWIERTPSADEKTINGQFFARNPSTNLGTIFYRGTQSGTPDTVYLKVYKTPSGGSEALDATHRQPLVGGAYAFSAPIVAGRSTYRVVYGTTTGVEDTDVTTITNLICGDAYIIQGQSNAQATDNSEPQVDTSAPWIITYDATLGWKPAYAKPTSPNWGSKVGFWGMKLAQDIVATHQMPVCIINGAVGGTRIDQHLPNPANPTVGAGTYDIYANLLNRVIAARLTHGIRGIFWHQGESDCSNFGPISDFDYTAYQQNFLNMSAAWKRDFPNFQRYLIYQVMPKPCSIGPKGDQLREVLRNLPRLYSKMSILNTLGIAGYEGCHFSLTGYTNLANRTAPLVSRDFYGVSNGGPVSAPNLKRAYFTSSARTAIALEFDQPISWSNLSVANFYVDKVAGKVTSGSESANIVTLQLSTAAAANATIDYLQDNFWSHTESVSTLLYGANGIPALTFADVPVGTLPAYQSWTSTKNLSGLAAASDADPDHDGVENALEFVLGGEPNPATPGSNSAALVPTSTRSVTNDFVFTFQRKLASVGAVDLTFQWSSDLTFPLPNTIPIGPVSSTTDGIAIAISNLDASTHTIVITIPAAKAVGGRLFARLQAAEL